MREDSYVPLPREVHPSLSFLEGVEIDSDRDTITVMKPPNLSFDFVGDSPPLEPTPHLISLDRRRISAPAPFVGRYPEDLAVYAWPVWVDKFGRYVAGSAELVWL